MRHHQQHKRSLFVSRGNCPVQLQELANYGKTIVTYVDRSEEPHSGKRDKASATSSKRDKSQAIYGKAGETQFKVEPSQQHESE